MAEALTTDGAVKPATDLTGGTEHVTAEVHRRSTGQLQRPSRIAIWRAGNAQLDVDPLDLAEFARGDEFTEPLMHRVV